MSKTNGSANQFDVTGEGIYIQLDHTRDWYVNNNKQIPDINKDVLLKLDQLDNNLQRFDNWVFGHGQQNHHPYSDNKLDMVYIIYRNVYRDNDSYRISLVPKRSGSNNWSGIAGLDYSGTLYLPNNNISAVGGYMTGNSSGITIVKYRRFFDDPGNRYLFVFLHEFGHFLRGGVHEYAS